MSFICVNCINSFSLYVSESFEFYLLCFLFYNSVISFVANVVIITNQFFKKKLYLSSAVLLVSDIYIPPQIPSVPV